MVRAKAVAVDVVQAPALGRAVVHRPALALIVVSVTHQIDLTAGRITDWEQHLTGRTDGLTPA
jgi:hypothetical protein